MAKYVGLCAQNACKEVLAPYVRLLRWTSLMKQFAAQRASKRDYTALANCSKGRCFPVTYLELSRKSQCDFSCHQSTLRTSLVLVNDALCRPLSICKHWSFHQGAPATVRQAVINGICIFLPFVPLCASVGTSCRVRASCLGFTSQVLCS